MIIAWNVSAMSNIDVTLRGDTTGNGGVNAITARSSICCDNSQLSQCSPITMHTSLPVSLKLTGSFKSAKIGAGSIVVRCNYICARSLLQLGTSAGVLSPVAFSAMKTHCLPMAACAGRPPTKQSNWRCGGHARDATSAHSAAQSSGPLWARRLH